MISIEDKILARIKRKGEGWVMTNSDFGDLAKSPTVDWSLYRLKDAGVIRPLLRGIYDYPKYSDFLHEKLTPDMTLTAQAIARKFQWRIQISGSAALNYLGLSTQVPMRLVYFSDGPHRAYEILGRGLEFKHISLKESQFSDPKIEIVIQSIRELGEAGITPEVMQKIRDFIPPSEREKLMKATQYVADWIHDKIKLICDGK